MNKLVLYCTFKHHFSTVQKKTDRLYGSDLSYLCSNVDGPQSPHFYRSL